MLSEVYQNFFTDYHFNLFNRGQWSKLVTSIVAFAYSSMIPPFNYSEAYSRLQVCQSNRTIQAHSVIFGFSGEGEQQSSTFLLVSENERRLQLLQLPILLRPTKK